MKPLKKKLLSPKKDKTSLKNLKKAPSNPIFGIPLEEAAKRSDADFGAVPLPIRKSVQWLNAHGMLSLSGHTALIGLSWWLHEKEMYLQFVQGLKEEGLYRVPGSKIVFEAYKASFDHGMAYHFTKKYLNQLLQMSLIYINQYLTKIMSYR